MDRGQGLKDEGFAESVSEAYDFSEIHSICDVGGGRERFIDEYTNLFGAAGLAVSKVMPTSRGPALIECILK